MGRGEAIHPRREETPFRTKIVRNLEEAELPVGDRIDAPTPEWSAVK